MNELRQALGALGRMRALLLQLSWREVQSRYAGTAAGIVWVYLPPLLTLACYYLVFDIVFAMRVGDGAQGSRSVGVYLIAGMLPWMTFSDTVARGMNSLLEAGSVLQKNPLPPVLFVTRSVLASGMVYAPLLALLYVFYFRNHGFAMLPLLGFALLLCLQFVVCWLLAYLLAIFAAAVRDTVQVVGFMLALGVFVSPILFPLSMFPAKWQWVLWINPMTSFVQGYQSVLLQGQWPAAAVWLNILGWVAVLAVLLNIAIGRTREELVDWL